VAHSDKPLMFFFETHSNSRKGQAILASEPTKASLVVGFDEQAPRTLQLDGQIRQIKPEEKEFFNKVYLGKFPEKNEKAKGDDIIFLIFTPTWWRWTDWTNKTTGKIIINSEN
jgi:hypothetical protein